MSLEEKVMSLMKDAMKSKDEATLRGLFLFSSFFAWITSSFHSSSFFVNTCGVFFSSVMRHPSMYFCAFSPCVSQSRYHLVSKCFNHSHTRNRLS